MLQELILVVALAAQILNKFVRSLVDFVELVTLDLRHTAASVAADAAQAIVEFRTKLVEFLALRSEAEVARSLEQLKWLCAS